MRAQEIGDSPIVWSNGRRSNVVWRHGPVWHSEQGNRHGWSHMFITVLWVELLSRVARPARTGEDPMATRAYVEGPRGARRPTVVVADAALEQKRSE